MQRLETQQENTRGYTPAEYGELVRRAEQIRAEREGSLTRENLAASAAEVGIREEDLQEAERQLAAEREAERVREQERARRRHTLRMAAVAAAVVLALMLVFSYNSLNSQRLAVAQAQSNLQSTLQRRADTLPRVAAIAREGAAQEREVAERLGRAGEGLRSGDLQTQLRANEELNQALTRVGSGDRGGGSGLYQDLMAEIAGSESRINVARQRYSEAATRYNNAAQSFPGSLFRPLFGFPREVPLFQPKGNVEQPPAL